MAKTIHNGGVTCVIIGTIMVVVIVVVVVIAIQAGKQRSQAGKPPDDPDPKVASDSDDPDTGSECVTNFSAGAVATDDERCSKVPDDPDTGSECMTKGSAGAVATDDERCSEVGLYVLQNRSGNAVDAAVASLLCLGVVNFQSSGIGGGLMMLVAKKNTSAPEGYTVTVIDAREVAPNSSRESDYMPVDKRGKNIHMHTGPLSIAIPGELRGMEMALDLFSNNTKDNREMIFEKAIKLAEEGFSPSWHLRNATDTDTGIERFKNNSRFNYDNLRNLVKSSDGKTRENITRQDYANTLKKIVEKGFQEFYTGPTAASLVDDINYAFCRQNLSSNCSSPRITMADLQMYRAIKRNPLQFNITGSAKVMYTAPAPASGSALALFLNIMQARVSQGDNDTVTYHYLLEASKFSNSHLMNLGDPAFNSTAHVTVDKVDSEFQRILNKPLLEYAESYDNLTYYDYMAGPSESNFGTTHVVVATSNGDVVTVTSTINDYFGSGLLSNSTGVILNDQMDDFYVPSNQSEDRFPYNHVEGGKRPLSSATPAIMIDSNGNLRLALGASGGRKIPPAVGQSAFFIVNQGESIEDGIKRARVYATLDDEGETIEERVEKSNLSREIQDKLNYTYRHYNFTNYDGFSVVQGIELQGSTFCAYSDPRKDGMAAAYDKQSVP